MKLAPSEGVTIDGIASLANDDPGCGAAASSVTGAEDCASPLVLFASTLFLLLVVWSGLAELKYLPPPGFVKTEYALRVAGRGRKNVEIADMSDKLAMSWSTFWAKLEVEGTGACLQPEFPGV